MTRRLNKREREREREIEREREKEERQRITAYDKAQERRKTTCNA